MEQNYILQLKILLSLYESIIILGTLILYNDNKNDKSQQFFYGVASKKSLRDMKLSISSFLNIMIVGYIWLLILLCGSALGEINGVRKVFTGIGIYINKFSGIMFSAWIALVGFLIVFSSFSRETWLIFNSNDIAEKYKIKEDIYKMFIMIIFEGLLLFTKPVISNLGQISLYNGVCFCMSVLFLFFFTSLQKYVMYSLKAS